MTREQYDGLVLAVENCEGHIDFHRDNFVRLNPDIPNTSPNWCEWMAKVSQSRLQRTASEPVDCSLFDKGVVE